MDWKHERGLGGDTPETPYQALLEAGTDEPQESALEKEIRFQPLRDAIDSGVILDEREVWVVEAIYWRRLSLSEIATELGGVSKSTVWRINDGALEKLRNYLG